MSIMLGHQIDYDNNVMTSAIYCYKLHSVPKVSVGACIITFKYTARVLDYCSVIVFV